MNISETNNYGEIRVCEDLQKISKDAWNLLIGQNFPFLEYDFLRALEISGSLGERTGWFARYVTLSRNGKLIGAVPLYLRSNSYGEYIFDWAWAGMCERMGQSYYPKLVVAIPFTPATGKRILVHPEENYVEVATVLVEAVVALAERWEVSSLHWLFTLPEEKDLLESLGGMTRYSQQFHWHNHNYQSFEDFLATFRAKKRNQVKRERRRSQQGVELEILQGEQIQSRHWEVMYAFYLSTIDRKWGFDYLNQRFFEELRQCFQRYTVMVMAKKSGQYIAGALNFQKGKHLYGRYWGSFSQQDCLHFEICYYQLIEHAICQNLQLFEAGAQGEHKLLRGFVPCYTYSAHWIFRPTLREIVRAYLQQERLSQQLLHQEYQSLLPFNRSS